MINIDNMNKCDFCIHGVRDKDYMFCNTCENKCNYEKAEHIALFVGVSKKGTPYIIPVVEDLEEDINDCIESMIEMSNNENISIYHIK